MFIVQSDQTLNVRSDPYDIILCGYWVVGNPQYRQCWNGLPHLQPSGCTGPECCPAGTRWRGCRHSTASWSSQPTPFHQLQTSAGGTERQANVVFLQSTTPLTQSCVGHCDKLRVANSGRQYNTGSNKVQIPPLRRCSFEFPPLRRCS